MRRAPGAPVACFRRGTGWLKPDSSPRPRQERPQGTAYDDCTDGWARGEPDDGAWLPPLLGVVDPASEALGTGTPRLQSGMGHRHPLGPGESIGSIAAMAPGRLLVLLGRRRLLPGIRNYGSGLLGVVPGGDVGSHLVQRGLEGRPFLVVQGPVSGGLDDVVEMLEIDLDSALPTLHAETILGSHEKSCRPEEQF